MKRLKAILLIAVLLAAVLFPAVLLARSSTDVFLYNEKLTFSPEAQIINNRTYVPLVPFFKSIGAQIDVDQQGKVIKIQKSGLNVSFNLAEKTIRNGAASNKRNLHIVTKSGRVFIPLRDTAEFLGYMVYWNPSARRTYIYPPITHVTVLAYKDILPGRDIKGSDNFDVLSLEKFQEQLDYLKNNDYYTMNLSELEAFIGGKKFYRKSVVITFDGAYSGMYKYAFPIMKKNGFKGVVFAETSAVDRTSKYTSWERLKTMSDSGLFDIESLTHNLYKFNGNAYRILSTRPSDIIKDLKISRVLIKAMVEKNAKALAYPMGTCNDAIIAYTKEAGFDMAFTLKSGSVSPSDSPFTIKRNGVFEWMDMSYFKKMLK